MTDSEILLVVLLITVFLWIVIATLVEIRRTKNGGGRRE